MFFKYEVKRYKEKVHTNTHTHAHIQTAHILLV